jgi:hypothetical protein
MLKNEIEKKIKKNKINPIDLKLKQYFMILWLINKDLVFFTLNSEWGRPF